MKAGIYTEEKARANWEWFKEVVLEERELRPLLAGVPLKSTVAARAVPRVGGGSGLPMRLISTQSGSGDGVKGLLGRFGLGKWW